MGGIVNLILNWARLTRIEHAFLSLFGIATGLIIAAKYLYFVESAQTLILIFLFPFLINLGSFALNDYFDMQADRINKRDRVLLKGLILPKHAFYFSLICLIIGGLGGFLVNALSGLITMIFSILAFLYNYKLKEMAFVGNIIISISMGIAFIFGYVAAANNLVIPNLVWILFFGASFAGLGREIVKTVQDVEGDLKARKAKTIAILLGVKNSLMLASLFFLAYILTIFLLLSLTSYDNTIIKWNYFYLGLLFISAAVYFVLIIKTLKNQDLEIVRKQSLLALGLALAAIFLALLG
jgi:4-hydroxybenzoate polyprenyltransferase